jgi:MscS family membrane protein
VAQVAKAIIVVLTITTVMEEWGYNVGGLVAGLGIGGLAVALAAQDALGNLFGYFVILADEPFVVGEYIVVDGVSGTVEELGLRSTRLRAQDQSLVTVPNKTVANSNITNWSRLSKRRLNMTLGIDLASAPEQVLSAVQSIREMLQQHTLVEPDSVVVQFVDFNNAHGALEIVIICFMKTPVWGDFQAARQDINLKIMDILQAHKVSLAVPTSTLSLTQAPSARPPKQFPPPKPEPTHSTATDSPVPSDAAN